MKAPVKSGPRTVLLTRPQKQTAALAKKLKRHGFRVLLFPTIQIKPPQSFKPLDACLKRIERYDWIIFTSVNGVAYFYKRLKKIYGKNKPVMKARIAALGPATAQKVKALGFKVNLIPRNYVAESLVEHFRKMPSLGGARILLPRAARARALLPQELKKMGAKITVVSAYQTVTPLHQTQHIHRFLKKIKAGFLVFTSSSTVENFVGILGRQNARRLARQNQLVSIGPITSKTAKKLGLKISFEAAEHTTEGILKTLLNAKNSIR